MSKKKSKDITIEIIRILKFPLAIFSIYLMIYFVDIKSFFKEFNNFISESNIKEFETPYIKVTYDDINKLENKIEEFVSNNNLEKQSIIANDLATTFNNIFKENIKYECFERMFTKEELKYFLDIDNIDNISFYKIRVNAEMFKLESCSEAMSINKSLSKGSFISIIKSFKTNENYFVKFIRVD